MHEIENVVELGVDGAHQTRAATVEKPTLLAFSLPAVVEQRREIDSPIPGRLARAFFKMGRRGRCRWLRLPRRQERHQLQAA